MALDEYRRKRDPRRTAEPFAGRPRRGSPVFVVQRHHARQLHFDLRLERDGVLASWAVPKGLPLERGERRLAVHVEDHPLDYASFEGTIPPGEYGAGTVEIWDRGTYELLEQKPDGGLAFRLSGARLSGVWTLVPAALGGDPRNWLLVRKASDEGTASPYEPMLATAAAEPPRGGGWLYEVKLDGFRALATIRRGAAVLTSRNGRDLTARFPAIARALDLATSSRDCVLDGEVCALDARGRTSFSALQQGRGRLVYYAFDLLERDGARLLELPLEERRLLLEETLDPAAPDVRLSVAFADGDALLAAAAAQGLEGIVAKRIDSSYLPGRRTHLWLKVKTGSRQEFVVAGWTRGRGRRAGGLGALVLAVREGDRLRWVGNVGTGFADTELARLRERLQPLERPESPFPEPPRMPRVGAGTVVWVEPVLVAEVRFAEWTHEGHLRAPVYLGLREDTAVVDVRRERPAIAAEIRRGRRVLTLSNLDKPFWPAEGIAKGELLAYYRGVAPIVVPHLRGRPFTMKRYPDGWQGKHFFQKDAPAHMPDWIRTVPVVSRSRAGGEPRVIDYAIVDDELGLLWMVNMGCIDLHAWTSRADRPERPDWVLFDLDPAEDAGIADVVEVALLVRATLDLVGLESFPKTSGARGMHVLVPIARRHTYEETQAFAAIVAAALARAHPDLVTTEFSKRKRRGVYVDANQNAPARTTACAYSVRPRAGAPVSTPLRWDEVVRSLDPAAFTMEAVLGRVERHGDLFAGVLERKQSLGKALHAIA